MDEMLAEMHGLIFDYFTAVGLPADLLVLVRQELSRLSCKQFEKTLLFNVFQYARTGNIELIVVNFSGESRSVQASMEMSVGRLKQIIAADNGLLEENQCIFFGNKALSNDTTLLEHGITPFECTLSLLTFERQLVYMVFSDCFMVLDSFQRSWSQFCWTANLFSFTREFHGLCNYSPAVTVIGNKLYLVGLFNVLDGYASDDDACVPRHIFSYELGLDRWTVLSPSHFDRVDSAAASLHGNLVVLGGRFGAESISSVESYDVSSCVWSYLPSMVVARHSFAAIELDDRLYAIGGVNYEDMDCPWLSSMEMYDCQNHRWEALMPMSRCRCGHVVAVIGGKLYVVGGEQFADDDKCEGIDLCICGEVYDPGQNAWNDFAPLEPRFSERVAALLSLEGKLWAVTRDAEIRIYDPCLDSWFDGPVFPSLFSELCDYDTVGLFVSAVFKVP